MPVHYVVLRRLFNRLSDVTKRAVDMEDAGAGEGTGGNNGEAGGRMEFCSTMW